MTVQTSLANTSSVSTNGVINVIGRVLFAALFLASAIGHFNGQDLGMAQQAGVPMASLLVPAAGVISIVGGLSILLGYKAKIGALLLIIFLIPVTFIMHNFWADKPGMMQTIQMVMFMKNIALVGAALMITQMGSGPASLDSKLG